MRASPPFGHALVVTAIVSSRSCGPCRSLPLWIAPVAIISARPHRRPAEITFEVSRPNSVALSTCKYFETLSATTIAGAPKRAFRSRSAHRASHVAPNSR